MPIFRNIPENITNFKVKMSVITFKLQMFQPLNEDIEHKPQSIDNELPPSTSLPSPTSSGPCQNHEYCHQHHHHAAAAPHARQILAGNGGPLLMACPQPDDVIYIPPLYSLLKKSPPHLYLY